MLVVFVHGWGVRRPDYGSLPDQLRSAFGPETIDIWLSEYVSYSDEVTMDDLAQAFERARLSSFPDRDFTCVTHSTGGPVIRTWLDRYNGPLSALVMLAPPNHGSALAQLGKGRLSRLKSWVEGVEPGQRILHWLELGSEESWGLNVRWLESNWNGRMLVLTGSTPDRALYDHLNSYTGEPGSDGVVRIASANLNYHFMRLRQGGSSLQCIESKRSPTTPFLVLRDTSHGGILNLENTNKSARPTSMMIVKVIDSTGHPVDDYDLLLTAGPNYSADALPRGFFVDRQRNTLARNTLTYFFDHASLAQSREFGFLLSPRPSTGPVSYGPVQFRSKMFLRPNETTMIEITLDRLLDSRVFQCFT